MLIIHGIYHWRPRRIAFRRDYCRSCEAERLATLVRTIDVLHVFWIPVLPIGAWSRWFCTSCGARPHAATRTRHGFKIAGALAMALMTLASWAVPIEPEDGDGWLVWVWVMRIGFPLALIGLAVSAFRQPPEPRLKMRLAAVRPFEGWSCPLCGGHLLNGTDCVSCGAEHRPLPARLRRGEGADQIL